MPSLDPTGPPPHATTAQAVKDSTAVAKRSFSPWLVWLLRHPRSRGFFGPLVCWRHPLLRIIVLWFIMGEDFFIYAEDPVQDSHVQANYPLMGHVMGLMTFWVAPSLGFGVLKFTLNVLAIVCGILLGRKVLQRFVLQRYFQLHAFGGGEGTVVCALFAWGPCVLVAVFVYNCFAPAEAVLGGHSMDLFYLAGAANTRYNEVGKVWQILSACVDLLSIAAISDAILQDRLHYPRWAPALKRLYTQCFNGRLRVAVFWVLWLGGSVICIVLIRMTGKKDGAIRWTDETAGGSSERLRGFLAALIVLTDLMVVAQDWDFPTFQEPLDLDFYTMVPGSFSTELKFTCLYQCLRRLPALPACCDWLTAWLPDKEWFQCKLDGKWVQYFPLVGVMFVDLCCMKTQILYDPVDYGQYVDPGDQSIWCIIDEPYLDRVYTFGSRNALALELISYSVRRSASGKPLSASAATDVRLNSKYIGSEYGKYALASLSVVFIISFVVLFFVTDWHMGMVEQEKQEQRGALGYTVRPDGPAHIVAPDPAERPAHSLEVEVEVRSTVPAMPGVIADPPDSDFGQDKSSARVPCLEKPSPSSTEAEEDAAWQTPREGGLPRQANKPETPASVAPTERGGAAPPLGVEQPRPAGPGPLHAMGERPTGDGPKISGSVLEEACPKGIVAQRSEVDSDAKCCSSICGL